MLTLTENAQTVVDEIAERADLPAGGGLRIARSQAQPGGLELALTAGPQPQDQVIETGKTPVFVEAEAAAQLDELALDATAAGEPGSPEPTFVLTPQAG